MKYGISTFLFYYSSRYLLIFHVLGILYNNYFSKNALRWLLLQGFYNMWFRFIIIFFVSIFLMASTGYNQSVDVDIIDTLENNVDSINELSIGATAVVSDPKPVMEPLKEGALRTVHNHTWVFYGLLLLLTLIGLIRLGNENYFKNLFKSFVSTQHSFRHIKMQVGQQQMANTLLSSLYYIVLGVFIFYAIELFSHGFTFINLSPSLILVILCFGVAIIYILRIGFLKLLGNLFDLKENTDEYIFNILLINKMLTLILIPILFIIAFGNIYFAKVSAIIGFVIIGFALLNRYARSRESMGKLLKTNKFHFFIYLCASEILPFIILGKLILANV